MELFAFYPYLVLSWRETTKNRILNMTFTDQETFSTENFEGPLDLLWHLIHRNELTICQVSLHQITEQYLTKIHSITPLKLDRGAEFIASAAALAHLKSKTLLPQHEQTDLAAEDEGDPHFEVIHHLLDYCRFKEAAKELSEREERQSGFYSRGVEESEVKKKMGLDHLSLEDLAKLFQVAIAKAKPQIGMIHEEQWRVGDKIKEIRRLLAKEEPLMFEKLFTFDKSRMELIVTFLALLELMKTGEAAVCRSLETGDVFIQVNPLLQKSETCCADNLNGGS